MANTKPTSSMLNLVLVLFLLFSCIIQSRTTRVPAAVVENTKDVPSLDTRFGTYEIDKLLGPFQLFQNPVFDVVTQQRSVNNGVFSHNSNQGSNFDSTSSHVTAGLTPNRQLEYRKQIKLPTRKPLDFVFFNEEQSHERHNDDNVHNQMLFLIQSRIPLTQWHNFPSREDQFGKNLNHGHSLNRSSNSSEQAHSQNHKQPFNTPDQLQNQMQLSTYHSGNQNYFQHQNHPPNEQGRSDKNSQYSTQEHTTRKQSLNKGQLPEEEIQQQRRPHEQQSHQNGQSDEPALILGNSVVVPTTTISDDTIVFEDAQLENPAQRQCVQDCPSTSDYKPVCGTNNVTYFNLEKFTCARKCGEHDNSAYR